MELIPFLLFITILSLALLRAILRSKPDDKIFPPGPPKLPIIGSLHHLIGPLPHRSLRDLALRYGPLMHLKLGEISMVVASSAEAAMEIMKTHDTTFASRPSNVAAAKIIGYDYSVITFAPYGNYWRQMRKICVLEVLSTKRVQSFQPIREEAGYSLVHSLHSSDGLSINLSELIFASNNDISARCIIGNKCKDQRIFSEIVKEVMKVAAGFNIANLFPSSTLASFLSGAKSKLKKIHQKLDRILERIIEEHRQKMRTGQEGEPLEKDLVDVLLGVQEQGGLQFPMTNNRIKAIIYDLFTAGTDTTAVTELWAMSELMRNPEVMKKAQKEVREVLGGKGKVAEWNTVHELKYLKLVIKETLRLHPPVAMLLPRECMETCEVLGYEIPKNTKVVVNAWATGRDPRYWPDAEAFKPERFDGSLVDFMGANYEFTPFGAGRRMCPGISFGLVSIEFTLAQLLYHFDWKLPQGMEPNDLDMDESFGITIGRKSNLYLHATHHVHL